MKYFSRFLLRKIAFKLAVVICILVISLLLVLGFSLTLIAQNSLKSTAKNNHEEIAKQAAREISFFIDRPIELMKTAAAFVGRTHASAWSQETVLVQLSLDFSIFEEIISVDLEGNAVASSSPGLRKQNWDTKTAFAEILKGNIYLSEIRIEDDHLPHITIGLPYYELGKIAGGLIANANLRGMWDIVDGIHIGKTGHAFLISEKGQLIAHPDKKLVLQNINLNQDPIFRNLFSTGGGTVELEKDGERYLASYAPVKGRLPLGLVVQMDQEEAYLLLNRMYFSIHSVLIFSLVISIVISFFIARRVVRPVKALERWSHRIALGDLNYSVAPKSLDEIGHLFIRFQRMTERLKRAKEKERLIAVGMAVSAISHRIKNALVSLKTFAQLFPEKRNEEIFLQKMEIAFPSAVTNLENTLKDLSQVIALPQLKSEPIDLHHLFEELRQSYYQTFDQQGIQFELQIDDALSRFLGDVEQLRELFVNLIQNSIQAMPEGGKLSLVALQAGSQIQIRFTDTGKGIPQENLNQIFKPFFTTKPGGMGLGLAVCRKIIEDHSGTVGVSSRAGEGTTFTINFPSCHPE